MQPITRFPDMVHEYNLKRKKFGFLRQAYLSFEKGWLAEFKPCNGLAGGTPFIRKDADEREQNNS